MSSTTNALLDLRRPVRKSQTGETSKLSEGLAQVGQVFQQVLRTGVQAAAQAYGIPGAGGLGGGTLTGFGGGLDGLAGDDPFAQNVALLQLQRQIQTESQRFQTESNISKAEHDAKMAAVRNIRP